MKIKRLEIHGFKSFADRQVFEFDDGISAIVGPNGCGKSNVVDAIKWVLGDMSPRSLRGKRMEDVIFAGSRTRKALPRAEVTLILDNESGLLPTEHTEVAVTRRLHRSGDSEYLLNRATCRLRDIRELFLDTGLGQEGNSIMEQGQIDALLAANPADRRGIFEEAAGVSRYKQRRKEAASRLQRTGDNLERLRDVLELEEKRLRSLKNQAAKARRFQSLREELAKKRVLRAVVRYRDLSAQREIVAKEVQALTDRESEAAGELASIEDAAKQTAEKREAAQQAVFQLESTIAGAAADVRSAKDRAEYATRDIADLRERISTLEEQATASRTRAEALRTEIATLEAVSLTAAERTEAEAARMSAVESELAGIDREVSRIRDAHDGAKRDALNALSGLGESRNLETELRTELKQADARLGRLSENRAELRVREEQIQSEMRELHTLAASLEEDTRARAEALEAAEHERARLVAQLEAKTEARNRAVEERATKRARLEVLERLAASREGMDAGAKLIIDAVANQSVDQHGARDGVLGILADLIEPSPEIAAELDLRIGHAGGAVVVRSAEDALRWIRWLREHGDGQRARFLCLDLLRRAIHPNESESSDGLQVAAPRALRDVVRSVVASTRVVENLEAGIRSFRDHGGNAVTPHGDRVTSSGAILGGRDRPALGLVGRTAELRQLHDEAERLTISVSQAQDAMRTAGEAVRASEEQIRRIRKELVEKSEDRTRRGEALTRVEREQKQVVDAMKLIDLEVDEFTSMRTETLARIETVTAEVQAHERRREALEERAEEAARGYVAMEASRKEAAERRMQMMLALAEAKAKAESAERRVTRARDEAAALDARAEEAAAESKALGDRLSRAEITVTEANAAAEQGEALKSGKGTELLEARNVLAACDEGATAADKRRREVQRLHDTLREELAACRLREGEFRTRLDALLEQVTQDTGVDLERVEAEAEATEDLDLEAIDAEVETMRRKLDSIGNVNLNAMAELEEVETHVRELQTQEKDLIEARVGLETAIKELDDISRKRFEKTFFEVRENFRTTFRRLFGGGRADVLLEDASDVLESGIEIVARPPGKEQRTISLLSGGERTLTATALLFAVFQAKPSPFAILDEVDAALDEANVRRLISLLREFTNRTQFVVITHAKSTMEAADLLYGVTMEEPGVSRRVAVRLTDCNSATPEPAAAG